MSDMIQNFIYKKISNYNRLEIKFNKSTSKKKNASQYTSKSNSLITLNL